MKPEVMPLEAEALSNSLSLTMVVGTSLAWLLFVVGVIWGRRHLLAFMQRAMIQGVARLPTGSLRRTGLRQSLVVLRGVVRLSGLVLILGATFLWAIALMEGFASTRELALRIERSLLQELAQFGHAFLGALPSLAIVVLLVALARILQETLHRFFEEVESGKVTSTRWDSITAQTTRRLATLVLWLATLIIAYPYIPGSETAAFKGISILAGLMLSLGSTNLVGQLMQGLIIIYTRALRPGEAIRAGEVEGVVEEVGLFNFRLRTINDEEIWLPNTALGPGVTHFSRGNEGTALRFTTSVSIGYDTPWPTVRDLLLAAARATPGVKSNPAPLVRIDELGDFAVVYTLAYSPEDPNRRKALLSAVHESILDRFHHAGVQIMSPHYLGDPLSPKLPPAPSKET